MATAAEIVKEVVMCQSSHNEWMNESKRLQGVTILYSSYKWEKKCGKEKGERESERMWWMSTQIFPSLFHLNDYGVGY